MSSEMRDGAREVVGGTTHANDTCQLIDIQFFGVYEVH